MSMLRKVVWSEGMLMSPHHLQQADAYHEQALAECVRATAAEGWGLLELVMNNEAIAAGSVALSRVRGIMPSGLPIHLSFADAGCPPARPIGPMFAPHHDVLEVFLGIPRVRDGIPNVSAEGTSQARYRVVREERFDFTAGGNAQAVDLALPRAALLFGGEALDDYECIKLAEVVRDSSGAFRFSPSFVPTCLRISASIYMMDAMARLLSAMAAKVREVKAQLSIRDQASIEYNASDITLFLLLNALSGFIPLVRHASEAGDYSGRGAYLLLAQLAGQLCSFASEADPLALPTYHHGDARRTFEPLFARIMELMRASVASRHLAVTLKGRSDGVHFGELLDPELQKAGVRFVLAVEAPLAEPQVNTVVSNLGKLGSWGDIQQLVSSATAGIPLTPARAPKEIPIRPNHSYFDVGTANPYWQNVLRERKVALYLPPPLQGEGVKVTLYGVP